MNEKDKKEMKWMIKAMKKSTIHTKETMAIQLITFLENVDRGKNGSK